ncbi:MAG: ADP-ribosylglycohydrolase family protein [Bacteroidales bacterium]|nr:ADP-ribosylglycohydrolase family protein [Bacteroidales bacterium]
MFGAILGDIAGSTYEFHNAKKADFELFPEGSFFTDDSILTVSIADAIMNGRAYGDCLLEYGRKYPNGGYGLKFMHWLQMENPRPYNSFGNGSAMRVSPVAYAFTTIEEALKEAKKTAEPTHNHPEGIKGAQATAAAIFLALEGKPKNEIKEFVEERFSYDLSRTYEQVRSTHSYNEICQETVPEALSCFLDSEDFEDALRKAIWLGGDSDTIACITGSVAEAYYKDIPDYMFRIVEEKLDSFLLEKVHRFREMYL